MKTALCVVLHCSRFRPYGFVCFNDFLDSLSTIKKDNDFKLFIIDNQSDKNIDLNSWKKIEEKIQKNSFIEYRYIEDQFDRGLTGAWNMMAEKAVNENFDLIIISNDDLVLNNTVDDFIKIIEQDDNKDNTFYGAITDETGTGTKKQHGRGPVNEIRELTGVDGAERINTFFFALTKKFYEMVKLSKEEYGQEMLFPERKYCLNSKDKELAALMRKVGKWAGQEYSQGTWVD